MSDENTAQENKTVLGRKIVRLKRAKTWSWAEVAQKQALLMRQASRKCLRRLTSL